MKRLLSILCAVFISLALCAQNTIKVKAPNLVGVGEQFNVTFVITGDDEVTDFTWDAGNDFQLVWGPQKGKTSSYSNINGQRSHTVQTTYTYILMPKSTGTFRLAVATAKVKGESISSEVPTIEVVSDGSSASSAGSSSGNSSSTSAQTGQVSSEDLFMRLSFSKTNVMVGETITATLKLYQRVNIAGFENAKFPEFNSFWSQEIEAPTNIEFQRENVDDKIYNSAVLRRWSLVPQKAGEVTIDPAELVVLVNIRVPRSSTGSIFDSFFQDDYQTIRKRVTTPATKIRVNALPAGAPASFGGGVGEFTMSAALTKDSLKTHDAASLKLTVKGRGNVSLLEAPVVNFPPDFEVYDVKTADIPGGKTFEYPFIPRSHGEFVIGPIEYSYYDINSRKYVSLSSGELSLNVAKSESGASVSNAGQIVAPVQKKGVRDLGTDIRYITTPLPSLGKEGSFFVGSGLFWILVALIIGLGVAVYFVLGYMDERRADVVGRKHRGAVKMASARLSQAGSFLKKGLYTAFYEELHRALLGYISDKFNMDAADMSKENIAAALLEAGAEEKSCAEFVDLLAACEFARYAPDAGREAMSAHYDQAVSSISTIESSMKRKNKGGSAAASVIAIMLMLGTGFSASAQRADSLWYEGVSAYEQAAFGQAIASWEAVIESGVSSEELYYNLGNAHYKNGDVAQAVLNYERALKLNPSYESARVNLEFVSEELQDQIEAIPEFFLTVWLRNLSQMLASDIWAILGLVLLAVCVLCVISLLRSDRRAVQKLSFTFAIVTIVLALSCFGLASSQKAGYKKADAAIVMRPVVSAKSSPSQGSAKDLFVLHEGTKITILDNVGSWVNIELSDGRQGWVKSEEIEVI